MLQVVNVQMDIMMICLQQHVSLVTTDVQPVPLVDVILVQEIEFYQLLVVFVKNLEDIMILVKLNVPLVNMFVPHVQLMMFVLLVLEITLLNLIVIVNQVTTISKMMFTVMLVPLNAQLVLLPMKTVLNVQN